MRALKARLDSERGWALVTAVMITGLMLTFGVATFAYVDTQVQQSGKERNRESAFNYSEGVMNAEAFILTRFWPGTSTGALPICTSTTGGPRCPNPTEVAKTFTGADFRTGNSWTTQVRDNGGSEPCQNNSANLACSYFFDDSILTSQPRWDANGDGEMWVHAQGVVRRRTGVPGEHVSLVARISIERIPITVPRNVISAGGFSTSGSPNLDVNTGSAPLAVRCDVPNGNGNGNGNGGGNGNGNGNGRRTGNTCVDTRVGQIAPPTVVDNYTQQQAMAPSSLDRLRARAQAEGGYYTSCPTNPTAKVVFVESGNCSNASLPPTSVASPGIFVIATGTLNVIGSVNYYGFIYLANLQNSCGLVFDSNGQHIFQGSIQVDGCGRVNIGTSSQTKLNYDSNAFSTLYGYGNANLVRNSFRQLPN